MSCAKTFAAAALALCTTTALAQAAASAPGTGIVVGHITCADTQHPARFAKVTLLGVPKKTTPPPPKIDASMDTAAMEAALKASLAIVSKTTMAQTQADIDGAFVAPDLAPGDYYVFASMAGYVNPLNVVRAALNAGADPHKPLPGVLMVHVTAEHTVAAELAIDRGASISGTVLWDDGTPVSGADVTVLPAKAYEKEIPAEFGQLWGWYGGQSHTTDDLGHFRLSGLLPGDYFVQASLQWQPRMNITDGAFQGNMMLPSAPLLVFAPAAFHKAAAKPITVHATEDRRDVLITMNLSGMHVVSGRVGSAEDHHGLNSATVKLTDTQDKDFVRGASVDAAGNFKITLVPPGTYDLTVTDAADSVPDKRSDDEKQNVVRFSNTHTMHSYDDAKQSQIVTDSDVSGLNIELTPSKTAKQDPELVINP